MYASKGTIKYHRSGCFQVKVIPINKYSSKNILVIYPETKILYTYIHKFKFHIINFCFFGKNEDILMTKNQIYDITQHYDNYQIVRSQHGSYISSSASNLYCIATYIHRCHYTFNIIVSYKRPTLKPVLVRFLHSHDKPCMNNYNIAKYIQLSDKGSYRLGKNTQTSYNYS